MVAENEQKIAGHLRVQNGYWQMIFSFKDSDGKRKTKSKSTGLKEKGNKKRAETMLAETKKQFQLELQNIEKERKEQKENKNNPKFSDFLLYWLNIIKNSVEITTYSGYCSKIKQVIIPYFEKNYPNLLLKDITPKHIQDFYSYKMDVQKVSANTIIHYHANIRKALEYAFKNDIINYNPADRVQRPKKNKFTGNMYDSKELDQLFKIVKGEKIELAIILGSFYGLRRSEIVGLKWDAIDFDKKTITISHTVSQCVVDGKYQIVHKDRAKTKSSHRALPLVKPFEEILIRLKKEQEISKRICGNSYCKDFDGYIYVDQVGNLIKPEYITSHFKLILKKNDLRLIRFHDLRHSCASLLYANGVSMKEIQEWLGHSQLSTTSDIYTHLDFKSKISSANAIIKFFPEKNNELAGGMNFKQSLVVPN